MTLDWNALAQEVVEHTRALIRIDTTNPTRNEREAAEYCAQVLREAGLEPRVLESEPGRASCICHLKSDSSGGDPLLLHGHLDVVPADPAEWTHPPFGAEIHDGYIWGRGAVDMKNMVAMCLTIVSALARAGIRPRREIRFAAVADEEAGSLKGSKWLVDHHPDLVRARWALGELGGFTLYLGGLTLYPVMVAEKGIAWIRARARGRQGHGSMPHDENPVVRLADALHRIGTTRLPRHNTEVMTRFFHKLGSALGPGGGTLLSAVMRSGVSDLLLDRLPDPSLVELFSALLHNTASPTVVRAGNKTNVIPSEAEADLDGRTLPGQSGADLMAELREICGHPEWLDLELQAEHPATEASPETPLFATIERVLRRYDPAGLPIPNMIPGFTDAWAWSTLGATCYGFTPIRFDPSADIKFSRLYHGVNERIPVDGLQWGLSVLYDVVREFAAPDAPRWGVGRRP